MPDSTPRPDTLWTRRNHLRLVAFAILLFCADTLVESSFYTLTDNLFLSVMLGGLLAIFVPCLLLAHQKKGTLASLFHLGGCRIDLILWSGLAGIAVAPPAFLLASLSARLQPIPQKWLVEYSRHLPDTTGETIVAVLAVLFVGPLCEELFFRGLIHRVARRSWGAGSAVAISSLVFALAHFEPWYLFGLIAVGALFAFVYDTTGSLTAAVVTHIVYNAVSFSLMTFGPENEGATEAGAGAIDLRYALLVAASLVVLVYILRKLKHNGARARLLAERSRRGPDFQPPE